jgi:hypothetical protein
VKATPVFRLKSDEDLQGGGGITFYMDCFQVDELSKGFEKAYIFSWIAFDSDKPSRRVLMDQHQGRPCHLHIGDKKVLEDLKFYHLDEAMQTFFAEVEKFFGKLVAEK